MTRRLIPTKQIRDKEHEEFMFNAVLLVLVNKAGGKVRITKEDYEAARSKGLALYLEQDGDWIEARMGADQPDGWVEVGDEPRVH